jgi:MinD-like ATPase involved in chromosome partitioning or flagellar assembly
VTNPAEGRRDSVPDLNPIPAAAELDEQPARIISHVSREQHPRGRPHDVAAYYAEDPVPLHAQPPPAESPAPVVDEADVSYVYQPDAMALHRRVERAEQGWRGRLNQGLRCRFAPGAAERTQRAALAMVRSSFPAARTVCVANVKGGSGKTPTALILSELLAMLRRESIVAADLNELRGTLGVRGDVQQPAHTVMDLLQYQDWLSRPGAAVGDLAGFLRRQESGALILASSENAGEMRSLTGKHCEAVRDLLITRYSTVVIDTGNNEAAPPWQFATRVADALVVPLRAATDHVWVAGRMLDGLHKRHETRHLPAAAIAVITDQEGARLDAATEQWLTERVGAVLYVPPDPEIAAGPIRADRLSAASKAAWTLVAAAVAEVCARPSVHDYRPTHSNN